MLAMKKPKKLRRRVLPSPELMYRDVIIRSMATRPSFTREDMKKLLRHPRKGDALVPSPAYLDRYRGHPADACALGYRMGAEVLVEYARERGHEAFLFYPILFLYHHHIELMLKKLILVFDEPGVRGITGAEPLDEDKRKRLRTGKKPHSLQWLWHTWLRPVAKVVLPLADIAGISSYIGRFN